MQGNMEATQALVAALLRADGYFVETDFKVKAQGMKTYGSQSHDIDLDLIAFEPKGKKVIVGDVKSYWGSVGLRPAHVVSKWTERRGPHRVLKIVNNKDGIQRKFERLLRRQIGASYKIEYVVFAGRIRNEKEVRRRLKAKKIFGRPIRLVVIRELLEDYTRRLDSRKRKMSSYINDSAVAALLAMDEYGMIKPRNERG